MIAIDTNVLVRLMVEDDEAQAGYARTLLARTSERQERIFVSDIVLSELEWVLDSAYGVPRSRVTAAMTELLADERFCFENAHRVSTAVDLYQHSKGDLSDYLLGLRARQEGADTTFTFDRALRDDERFTLLR